MRQSLKRITRLLCTPVALLGAVTMSVHAENGATGGGSESALVLTSTLTLILVALIFFVLIMPEDDRRALGAFFRRTRRLLNPKVSDQSLAMDHEYDGIRELDNRIPPWFSTLFIATVLFGGIYMVDYHVLGSSKLMIEEYTEEVATADLQRRIRIANEGSIDEAALVALRDPAVLQRGGEQFKKFCVSCHGSNGEGIIGPNLTDDYWIHGGGIKNVYNTIKSGVPAKGMISWQLVFTPRQIQEIASYVLSLHGTNPPTAKKPEGDLFIEQDSLTVAAEKNASQQPPVSNGR